MQNLDWRKGTLANFFPPHHQNLNLIEGCSVLMPFARVGNPNCVLPTVVFQSGKVTWFITLFASTRTSMLILSLIRNVRVSDAFKLNWAGPVMEFRPAFP